MRAPASLIATIGALLIAAAPVLVLAARAALPQAKTSPVAGNTERGRALFAERCAICHYDRSTARKMGPGLKGIYTRGQFADGRKVDDSAMVRWIEKGGKDMPPLKDVLKPEEVRALVGYLRTL